MITGLDHIAMAVNDREVAVAKFTALLGREPNWRGEVGDVHHAWFQLDNMALDLIAPKPDAPADLAIRRRLARRGEHIFGLGFRVADLEAAARLLKRRGVTTHPAHDETTFAPDGTSRTWKTVQTEARSTGGAPLFIVEHRPGAPDWPVSPPVSEAAAAVSGLDHVVVTTPSPDRAAATFGARFGLDMRLDRSNPDWGSRLMFFRCGGVVIEVAHSLRDTPDPAAPDRLSGLAWQVADPHAARDRMASAGLDVSEVRDGRKPGTEVFTVRSGAPAAPFLMLKPSPAEAN